MLIAEMLSERLENCFCTTPGYTLPGLSCVSLWGIFGAVPAKLEGNIGRNVTHFRMKWFSKIQLYKTLTLRKLI